MKQEAFRIPQFVEASLRKCDPDEVRSVQDEIARALSRGVDEDEIKQRAISAGWESSVVTWLIASVRDNGPQELTRTSSAIKTAGSDPSIATMPMRPLSEPATSVSYTSDLKKIEGHLAEIKSWTRFFGVLLTISVVIGLVLTIYSDSMRRGH